MRNFKIKENLSHFSNRSLNLDKSRSKINYIGTILIFIKDVKMKSKSAQFRIE